MAHKRDYKPEDIAFPEQHIVSSELVSEMEKSYIELMEEAQNIIACGAGGSTKLIDHSTGKITRHFNYKFPYEYISRYEKMTAYKPQLEEFLSQL